MHTIRKMYLANCLQDIFTSRKRNPLPANSTRNRRFPRPKVAIRQNEFRWPRVLKYGILGNGFRKIGHLNWDVEKRK